LNKKSILGDYDSNGIYFSYGLGIVSIVKIVT